MGTSVFEKSAAPIFMVENGDGGFLGNSDSLQRLHIAIARIITV
jgi:hypothetical protein